MSSNPTKVPAIPRPPNDVSPEVRRYLESVQEALEIRLGRRGEPEDRAVTLRELVKGGLAKTLKSAPFDPNNVTPDNVGFINPSTVSNSSVPPPPTSFTASAAYSTILLSWNIPSGLDFISHLEIWRADSDDLGQAVLYDISTSSTYSDPVGGGQTKYYWVRFVSQAGIVGPFNDGDGTSATTATDVDYQLNVLNEAITSSELAESLSTPIGNLPDNTAAAISNLDGQFTVKIDNNGNIAGFGLASTTNAAGDTTSDFLVAADRFALVPSTDTSTPEWTSNTQFVVGDEVIYNDGEFFKCKQAHTSALSTRPHISGGADYWDKLSSVPFSVVTSAQTVTVGDDEVIIDPGVYIDSAFIKAGTITSAQIGSLNADVINSGSISANRIDTGTINVANVNIEGTSSTGLNIKSADSGERMEITNDSIKVYDSSGTLRVHIGNI